MEPGGFGFLNGEEGTIGRTIANDICNCLFYFFPHLKSLLARFITLYSIFDVLYNKASLDQDYNNRTNYKHKIVQLEKIPLIDHGQKLLTIPFMTTKIMAKLKERVLHSANSITKYSEYLDTQNKRMMGIHNLPHPVRTPGDGISTSLRHIPGSIRSQNLVEKYSDMKQQLQMKFEFDPVCVNDSAPADRQRHYHYIQDISMPFNVTLYSYCGVGQKSLCISIGNVVVF